jgi:hypothetical protein
MASLLEATLQEHLDETIGNSGRRIIGEVRQRAPITHFVEGEYEIDRISGADENRAIREVVTFYFTEQGYEPTQLSGLPKPVSLVKRGNKTIGINISAPLNPDGTPGKIYRLSILKLPFIE